VGTAGKVAAIGPTTAAAWGEVDLVPQVATQEGLLAELPRPARRVLFAGAEGARRLLADELGADVVALYRAVPLAPALPAFDLAVVASPSAAGALAALVRGAAVISIGPETSAAAAAAGLRVEAEAATPDLDGLVSAVAGTG
jgi:hydroxymethylbilane synthase